MLKQSVIIGVCGHVDHGKTALIRALTGIDTDRLKEEKARGISIEAGFAYLETPNGERLGIVDMPGHERFVGNMLAAASGIDIAMLVVAADEGVRAQTREHLDILRLLNVKRGIIAVTKQDIASEEMLADTCEQIGKAVEKTFLSGAEIVEVSAKTGYKLDNLRETLYKTAYEIPVKRYEDSFRLPIDRVFSVQGFGTVVTGTLIDGRLDPSVKVMLYPTMKAVRIRGMQVHSRQTESVCPGERVAVNLAIKRDAISRGDVLAAENGLTSSMMLDTELEVLEASPFTVKNNSRVHLYAGGKRLLAKIVLLDADELAAGARGFAQLRLTEPLAVRRSDGFIIRFYSPEITIGGGEILDANPLKRRRFKPDVIARLEALKSGQKAESCVFREAVCETAGEKAGLGREASKVKRGQPQSLPTDEVERIYLDYGMNPAAASVAAAHMDAAVFSRTLALLVRENKLVKLDDATYIHKTCYDAAVSLYKELEAAKSFDIGRYRDKLATSRRVAFALIKHFEENGVKRKYV